MGNKNVNVIVGAINVNIMYRRGRRLAQLLKMPFGSYADVPQSWLLTMKNSQSVQR